MRSSLPYVLALFTALCWGIAPLLGKAGLQRVDPLTGVALRTFAISGGVLLLLAVTGNLDGFRPLTPRATLFLALDGLLAGLVGQFAYYAALKYGDASRVVPVASAFPAVAFLGGVLFFAERVTPLKTLGVLLILAGILVMRLAR